MVGRRVFCEFENVFLFAKQRGLEMDISSKCLVDEMVCLMVLTRFCHYWFNVSRYHGTICLHTVYTNNSIFM